MKARIRNGEAPKPDPPPSAPTVDTVETYAKKLKLREKQLARATMVGVLTSLSALMSAAVEDDDCPITLNPAAKLVKLLKDPNEKKSRRLTKDKYFERDEATDLLAKAREDFPEWYPFVLCGLRTGLRLGELLGLLRKVFAGIVRKAELRHRSPHAMRHTFISLLLQNGESPAYVQKQAGHKSMDITINVYGHFMPGGNRAAVDRLDDVLREKAAATA